MVRPLSSDWFISFKDLRVLWEDNWFAVVLEIAGAILLYQVFRHAKRTDNHSLYLVLASLFATTCFEILPVIPRPGYQLWWYHQGAVNILKQRVPSYVITLYALFHYAAYNLTSRSNLPELTRSLVTAVCAVLTVFPWLWLAPRLLLIFMHFDDPVFKNKLLDVPYIQLVVLTLLFFHTTHLYQQNYDEIVGHDESFYNLVRCSFQTGLVSAIYTIVEQYLLYILFNLTMKLPTGVCLCVALLVLGILAKKELQAMQIKSYSVSDVLSPLKRKEFWTIVAAFAFVSTLPLWLNISNLKSTSDKLELGPCNITHDVSNTSPLEITRRRYICPDDVHHLHFDFHCVPRSELQNAVKAKTRHYTVCGKSLEHPYQVAKYMVIYSIICLSSFYFSMLFSFNFGVQKKIHERLDTMMKGKVL
ncbi:uncharacterized protein LOC118179668 [Stegodyphus dumicola]|uniref:uncharacterized protein LOC118179668 n=1 Tax=Stegodyphus dumicola TaxID=202533 RepID=UPI0015AF8AA8|nr:uncharacterized protein LOC118179668 [Stegodyphus dumicola]